MAVSQVDAHPLSLYLFLFVSASSFVPLGLGVDVVAHKMVERHHPRVLSRTGHCSARNAERGTANSSWRIITNFWAAL